jgi:hypothetical protein
MYMDILVTLGHLIDLSHDQFTFGEGTAICLTHPSNQGR